MKAFFLAAALALIGTQAAASEVDYVRVARAPNGAVIELFPQSGPCMAGAKIALHTAADGTKTPGCYAETDAVVSVVWFDTDTSAIPKSVFKKAEPV